MNIGGYTLHSVAAGCFKLDGGAMFGVVPKVLWSKPHPADELNRVDMVSRSLLLIGEGRIVLVNTGIGQSWADKERGIYAIDGSVDLLGSLAELGVAPERVTHVIQTHLHFDHVGGATRARGRSFRPAFPNAVHFVQRQHYLWVQNPSERDRASFLPHTWQTLIEGGQLTLLDGEQEILPGISLQVVQGHTPGQQLPRISDGATTLLYCSDLIPFASQVRIPWIMGYDLRPLDTVREKRELLSRAAAEDWLLFLEHDPRFAVCRVTASERGFEAAETAEEFTPSGPRGGRG